MQRIQANSGLGDNLALLQIRCRVVPTYPNLTPNPNSKPYPNPKRFDNKINNAGTTLPRVRNGRVVQGSELARLPCSNSKVIGLLVSHYMLKLKNTVITSLILLAICLVSAQVFTQWLQLSDVLQDARVIGGEAIFWLVARCYHGDTGRQHLLQGEWEGEVCLT